MIKKDAALPPGWKAEAVRNSFACWMNGTLHTRPDALQILRAYHILQWRRDSLYCGSCGHKNEDSKTELARVCPVCGRIEYPRICPAIITMINRGNRQEEILLAHNKNFKNNMYSLIAGFNEAGETLEQTVEREIREEVNIKVKNIRYLTSQAWPFPASLMLGFKAEWESGEPRPDGVEIEDARWFTRETIPQLPQGGSVAYRIINGWLESQRHSYSPRSPRLRVSLFF
jgi:NAD+ diphosphatase